MLQSIKVKSWCTVQTQRNTAALSNGSSSQKTWLRFSLMKGSWLENQYSLLNIWAIPPPLHVYDQFIECSHGDNSFSKVWLMVKPLFINFLQSFRPVDSSSEQMPTSTLAPESGHTCCCKLMMYCMYVFVANLLN